MDNTDIATVSDLGIVSGVKKGETLLTVTGTWQNENFIDTIAVEINELLSLSWIEPGDKELYTSDIQGGTTSIQLTAKVFKNNQAVALTSDNLRYYQCDENGSELAQRKVITLSETGVVEAKSRGETYVTYAYTQEGESYVAKPIKILSKIPVIETDVVHIADLQATNIFDYTPVLEQLNLGSATVTDVSILDGEKEIFLEMTSDGAKGIDYKAKTLLLYNSDGYAQKIATTLYTLVISSAAELNKMSAFLEENKYNVGTESAPYYNSDGYFLLDKNIDYNGVFNTQFITAVNKEKNYENGFVGTFDGRGYTISNLKMNTVSVDGVRSMGLITSLGVGGTFKNLNVQNFSTGSASYTIAVIGEAISGKVENLSISVKDTTLRNTGALSNRISPTADIRNVIVTLQGIAWSGSEHALLAHDCQKTSTLRNVYVIDLDSSVQGFEGTWTKKNSYSNAFNIAMKDDNGKETCAFFASVTDFKNSLQTTTTNSVSTTSTLVCDFDSFDESMWNFTTEVPYVANNLPVDSDSIFLFETLIK